ncbi:MAG: LLM class flavin-dependent oxidoreductase [Ilumatobacteraceae bacterium]
MTILTIRFDLRNPAASGVATADRFAACLEMCEWAERSGFVAVVLSEHHGVEDGYLPSIFTMAAAIAARTERMLINLAAVIAPLHDPIRLAEDAAVVDQLSRGRLHLVLANGYVPAEFETFGVALSDRPKLVTEAVATLRQAWSGEPFTFRGRTARVTPRPFQPAGPPISLGGSSDAAARRAARLGTGFMPSLPQYWQTYRDECLRLGHADPGPGVPFQPMFLYVAHDVEAAWGEVGEACLYEMNAYGAWAAEGQSDTGYQPLADVAALRSMGMHLVVTPEECVELARSSGMLMFHPMIGGLAPEVAWRSLRLFESDVLPHLPS